MDQADQAQMPVRGRVRARSTGPAAGTRGNTHQRPPRSLPRGSAPLSSPVPDVSFDALGVPAPLVRALADRGITAAFPIQAATLPDSLAGRDVLGRGRTGSGKTVAFAIPTVVALSTSRRPRRPNHPRA